MEHKDEQPDEHAAARERHETKRRGGMRVSGRSTRDLPRLIARRDQDTLDRSPGRPAEGRPDEERPR